MIICKNCGTEITENSKFCIKCGQRQDGAAAPITPAIPVVPVASAMPESEAKSYIPEQPVQSYAQDQYVHSNQQPAYENTRFSSASAIMKKSIEMLKKKPVRLWGLSLMYMLLSILAGVFGVLPIVSMPIIFVLSVGMTAIYLDGYRGKEVNSNQLFIGFKNFWRMAGGIGWMELWVFIWALIPIAGIVFAIMKTYAYRFVPYILLSDEEISATDALKRSMEMTNGHRGKMFCADLMVVGVSFAVLLVLGLLSFIPILGYAFRLLFVLAYIAVIVFAPLLAGIIGAAFYDEIETASK